MEASRAVRQAEVGAAKTMIERTEEHTYAKLKRPLWPLDQQLEGRMLV